MTVISAAAAASLAVAARRAPAARNGSARRAVLLWTTRGNPALRTRWAIGVPIVPRPIQAMVGFIGNLSPGKLIKGKGLDRAEAVSRSEPWPTGRPDWASMRSRDYSHHRKG